jgi:anthranilate synthase/aminodeoxychorismate synthase-like glutamine amidotransferase
MILIIDNYDSFTYNLVQLIGGLNPDIRVIRNDAESPEEIAAASPSHIILSPGPGYPKDAGICEELIIKLGSKIPILGVCLGHQAICEAYGAKISHARRLMHGKKSKIHVNVLNSIFKSLPPQIEGARYHSLVAVPETMPDSLEVIAQDDIGEIMAVRHREYPVYGLQFHPESVLTPKGDVIIRNFLHLEGKTHDSASD